MKMKIYQQNFRESNLNMKQEWMKEYKKTGQN